MDGGVGCEVLPGKAEQGESGPGAVFLDVYERAGELDEAFVKVADGLAALGEPDFFEDFVGFEKELLIEAFEIAEVMGVEDEAGVVVLFPAVFDQLGDARAFVAH